MERIKKLAQKGILQPQDTDIIRHQERPLLGEKYQMIPDAIVISGPSGTGKTTFTEELAQLLPGVNTIFGGEWFRERIREEEGNESNVVGYADRPKSLDQQLDDFQENAFRTASLEGKKYLTEARLGIVNATNVLHEAEKNGQPPPNIIRILFTADQDTRLDRLVSRELQKQSDNPDILQLSPDQMRQETLERENGDLKQWASNHDILRTGIVDPVTGEEILRNPYDKNLVDDEGNPLFYDYLIDSTNLSLLESVVEAISLLKEQGHIKKIEEQHLVTLPQASIVFP